MVSIRKSRISDFFIFVIFIVFGFFSDSWVLTIGKGRVNDYFGFFTPALL